MGSKTKNELIYDLPSISTGSFRGLNEAKPIKANSEETGPPTKITIEVNFELFDRIRDYAHWEGMTQNETVLHALERFFEENRAKSRPEAVRKREAMRMSKDKRRNSRRR